MTQSDSDGDSDDQRGKEDAEKRKGNPGFYYLSDVVSITESLKTRGLDLLFFSFSLKHVA